MPRLKAPIEATMPVVGREIRRHTARRGLLLDDVARQAEIGGAELRAIIAGLLIPSARDVKRLAAILRVEPDQLIVDGQGEIDAGYMYAREFVPLCSDMLDDEQADAFASVIASLLRLPATDRTAAACLLLDTIIAAQE